MSGFDISKEKEAGKLEDDGTFVHINDLNDTPMYYEDADGKEQEVGITVAGAHSTRYRNAEGKQRRRRLKPKDLTGARLHEDSLEKVIHCTLSWQGIEDKGEEVRCDAHNVRMIYTHCPWVLDQVVEAMNDHTRFFEKESSSQRSTFAPSVDLTNKRNMVKPEITYAKPLLEILPELFVPVNFWNYLSVPKSLSIYWTGYINFMVAAELVCLLWLPYRMLLLKRGLG